MSDYDFGDYAIVDAATHNFEKRPEWEWKIKPVTSGMELEMSKFNAHNRIVLDPDGTRRQLPPTWMELCHREIAMTFGGTNIAKKNGDLILAKDASIEEIERVLKVMPQELVLEIWRAVGVAYPKWGPADPNLV